MLQERKVLAPSLYEFSFLPRPILANLLGAALLAGVIAGCVSSQPNATSTVPAPPPPAPDMREARFAATATVLGDGTVLIAGGAANQAAASAVAEIYQPALNGFILTGGMLSGRAHHTATLLKDGRVLIAGGIGKDGRPVRAAELYDPASNQFLPTGNMLQARYDQTATLLPNGKILFTGGGVTTAVVTNVDTAELYDPASGSFAPTGKITRLYDPEQDKFFYEGKMNAARARHTATLLASGKVLIAGGGDAGGKSLASSEVYDPATGGFSPIAALTTPRQMATATRLRNGQVLITGGLDASGRVLATAELYDPTRGSFTPVTRAFSRTGTNMTDERQEHTATLLANGSVLIAGGANARYGLASAEIYNPTDGSFTCVGGRVAGPHSLCSNSMTEFRDDASAALLPNGTVLIAAGYNFEMSLAPGQATAQGLTGLGRNVPFSLLRSAELYYPSGGRFVSTLTLWNAQYGTSAAVAK
jgi:hypothetical protein